MNMLWFPYSFPTLQTPIADFSGVINQLLPLTALIIPFVFVLCVLIITFIRNYKNRELQHETIRLLVEKGLPVPPELFVEKNDNEAKKHDDRKTGLILIAVGIGLYFFFANLSAGCPNGIRWIALIPGLIGVAMLLNWWLNRMDKKNETSDDKKN
jgi:hypothetical protein